MKANRMSNKNRVKELFRRSLKCRFGKRVRFALSVHRLRIIDRNHD